MLNEEYFADDMRSIISDWPISCSFGSVQFQATTGETRRSYDVSPEGILNEADLEIMAVIDDFGGTLPNVQQTITVDGVKYHITERVVEPFGAVVHFILRRV